MIKGEKILIVDDDRRIRRMLHTSLAGNGYEVDEVATADAAIRAVREAIPAVILLDLNLPDAHGSEVLKEVRGLTDVPVIVLSVCASDEDKVDLLDLGADDYLTKPFAMTELLARIRAAIRRMGKGRKAAVFKAGAVEIDLTRHLVFNAGKEVHLTPTEFAILRLLAGHPGRIFTHEHILKKVWGAAAENEIPAMRVHINQLRHKLEPDPSHPSLILTEPGLGYRLSDRDLH